MTDKLPVPEADNRIRRESLPGMAFCPRCGAGYLDSQERCVRCHWKIGDDPVYLRDEQIQALQQQAQAEHWLGEYERGVSGALEATLRGLIDVGDHPDEWWCARCQDWVPGEQVTYEEIHDTCQGPVLPQNPYAMVEAEHEGRVRAEWQRERAIDYWTECSYAVRGHLHAGDILDRDYAAAHPTQEARNA